MVSEQQVREAPRVLFTAPWEPVVVRRGDALGLRALADQLADAVAPDLSNRVRDGRWVTILAWCLSRSQEVFHASGGQSVETRSDQSERYGWLRPLELMWVARTIALADDWRDRTLAGQRRVRPWYEDDERTSDRFGMSADQFRAYRQTGVYGGYRVAFRKWPGMTVSGDGWTPGPAVSRLAKWLDARMGPAAPAWPLHGAGDHEDSPFKRPPKLGLGGKHDWWLRHWPEFDRGGRGVVESTLPRPKTEFRVLPECEHLKPVVFGVKGNGVRRLEVACEVAVAAEVDHAGVCAHLSQAFASDNSIALLPRFTLLADAGMAAMDLVAEALRGENEVPLSEVAAGVHAADVCEELMAAAQAWRVGARIQVRHVETADRFATAIPRTNRLDCLRALLEHHEINGGGLRWFVLRNGKVERRTPQRGGSSRYRFRLWSLCRLAVQCGVLRRMPAAILDDDAAIEDSTSDDADE